MSDLKLPKLDVVGSIPIARSSLSKALKPYSLHRRGDTGCSLHGLVQLLDDGPGCGMPIDISANDARYFSLLPAQHFGDHALGKAAM